MSRLSNTLLAAVPAALALAQLAAAGNADAAPMQRRLQIETELVRDASFSGVERGRARLVQAVGLQVVLSSDGVPAANNPLDPDDGRRQLEWARRAQQKVEAAQQRVGTARAEAPSAAAMQAQAQALMARCGQDRDCLMREATAMSAARVGQGQPQVQARLQAYGDAVRGCERRHAAAKEREACIAQARRQAGGSDESDADDAVETPFLIFTGTGDCRLDAATKIDERVDGSFDDVQGVVPFTTTTKADGRERDPNACALMMAVLDTRDGRLWTRVMPALRGVPGRTVRAEKGRQPQGSDVQEAPRWHEGETWLADRLARLGAAGSDRMERALPGGKLELKVRWSFGAP